MYNDLFHYVDDGNFIIEALKESKNSQQYYEIALGAVKKDGLLLLHVNKNEDWAVKNCKLYKEIVLAAVNQNGNALAFVNQDWISNNSANYKAVVQVAVEQDPDVLRYVNKDWISKNSDKYEEIARVAVKKDGYDLAYVNKDWVVENPKRYYEIALEAVNQNGNSLQRVNEWVLENSEQYYNIALVAVKQNGYVLRYVNEAQILQNSEQYEYYEIVLAAVNQNGYALRHVDDKRVVQNSRWYYDIVLVAVKQNGLALAYVNKDWVVANPQAYYDIALAAVKQNGHALECVNKDWALKHPTWYKEVALVVVEKDGNSLQRVNDEWVLENSEQYYNIALEAVKEYGYALEYVNYIILSSTYYEIARAAVKKAPCALRHVDKQWVKQNPQAYYNIALAAVKQNGDALQFASTELKNDKEIVKEALSEDKLVLQYAGDVFRNNIEIVISSFIQVDRAYSRYPTILRDEISKILSMTSIKNDILLYVHMFNNQNVSNNFKHALFEFFINEFENNTSLNDEQHSQQLYTFLSIADQFALQHTKFPNLSHNHNAIIKNSLAEDTHHLKHIKNLNNIYGWSSKNCCLLDYTYTKIINMINPNQMKPYPMRKDLIKLVLCYLTIKDLLALYDDKLEAKLEGKCLDIDLKFFEPAGYTSTGIEALVDAINSQKGYLRNKGEDSNSINTIYCLDDCQNYIELK